MGALSTRTDRRLGGPHLNLGAPHLRDGFIVANRGPRQLAGGVSFGGPSRKARSVLFMGTASANTFPGDTLWANLNDDGAHSIAAGILPVCSLDLVQLEDRLDWHRDPSFSEPFKKQLQVRRKVL
jgi:hypothetical protein